MKDQKVLTSCLLLLFVEEMTIYIWVNITQKGLPSIVDLVRHLLNKKEN